MSQPIGPGDWVEFLGPVPGHPFISNGLFHRGAVYSVAEVGRTPGGQPWIAISGKPRPTDLGYNCPGWAAEGFRPIYRPKSEIIEALKRPVTVIREVETA